MKRFFFSSLIGMLFIMLSMTEAAREWKEPSVEYSADMYMETEEFTLKAKVYHALDKERRDQEMAGEKTSMIIRRDKKVMWTLMPDAMMYMEIPFVEGGKDNKEDLSNFKIEETIVGDEVVNGIKTTKSKIIMTNKKTGEKLGGFWWLSKEGIVVKMDVIAVEKGTKTRIKQELKNLKIGKQDPKLFEIPAGYSKMTIPMGGGFDMPVRKRR